MTKQSSLQLVVIQTVLCEVAVGCEDLTNKCIAYKKVVSKLANSGVRKVTSKCVLRKRLLADKNNQRKVIVVIIVIYVVHIT